MIMRDSTFTRFGDKAIDFWSGFASGVYLYRLTTDKGFVETKKLLLLK
jgi:hypothetical protein